MPSSVEKLSSRKLVLGAKKAGDCCSRELDGKVNKRMGALSKRSVHTRVWLENKQTYQGSARIQRQLVKG